jgi:hypothetical protein
METIDKNNRPLKVGDLPKAESDLLVEITQDYNRGFIACEMHRIAKIEKLGKWSSNI